MDAAKAPSLVSAVGRCCRTSILRQPVRRAPHCPPRPAPRRHTVSIFASDKKRLVVETTKCFTYAIERGVSHFLFNADDSERAKACLALARFSALYLAADHEIRGADGAHVGRLFCLSDAEGVKEAAAAVAAGGEGLVLIDLDATAWKIISAETLLAARAEARRAGHRSVVLARVRGGAEAALSLEILGGGECGFDGVVLKTEEHLEIDAAVAAVAAAESHAGLKLTAARVTRVESAGTADRVCVDLTSLLQPGEGLLTGSFASGLFLVHSEALASDYIASRPFRVNAGAVHAYVLGPNNRTHYLSELRAGSTLLAVDASTGRTRPVVVGRCKIERRPMVLVEAEALSSGRRYSLLLQNAETVRLVRPGEVWSDARAVSVAALAPGQEVLLLEAEAGGAARHTGLVISEAIIER